jgi:copper chaperone
MLRLKVNGMTCGHCVHAVETAVRAAAPGARVQVDLSKGEVTIDGNADPTKVEDAIIDAGYEAASMVA